MKALTPTTNLSLEAARQSLRRLGLYGLLAQAETLMLEPWFARVLEIEDAERARRSLKRRLDDARLGAFKPIADFDWAWPVKCNRSLVEELFTLAFVEEAANVVFVGPNGLGKQAVEAQAAQALTNRLKVEVRCRHGCVHRQSPL